MNIWYRGYADARNMINQGYDILNTQDADLYIVPEAGYYNNYLNTRFLYNEL